MEFWLASVVSTALLATPLMLLLPRLSFAPTAKVSILRIALACCLLSTLPMSNLVNVQLPQTIRGRDIEGWHYFSAWMFLLWSIGFLQVAAITAVDHVRWRRSLGTLRTAEPGIVLQLCRVSADLGCKVPHVKCSNAVKGALVAPGIRPILVLGPGPIDDSILRHELSHLRGLDVLWLLFARLVVATFWFHPGAWELESSLHLAQEIKADLTAAADEPLSFAKLLIESSGALPPALVQAFASDGEQMAARIRALRMPPKTGMLSYPAALCPLFIVFCAGLDLPTSVVKLSGQPQLRDSVAVRPLRSL